MEWSTIKNRQLSFGNTLGSLGMLSISKRLVGPTPGTVGYLFWNGVECAAVALFLQKFAYRWTSVVIHA
jgi:hypothetical protein